MKSMLYPFFALAISVTSASLFTHSAHADTSQRSTKAVSVAVVQVQKDTIYDWVTAEGIAQGIRREYLNFERGGKVTFIARDDQGIPLRAGSFVRGPQAEGELGQLLASVDERADEEALKQSEAELRSAGLNVEQALSAMKQAKNSLALAESEFERIESIWKKKLISKQEYDASRTQLLNSREAIRTAKAQYEAAKSQQAAAGAGLNQARLGLEKTSIYAPFDGVLRRVNIRQGDYFSGPGAGSDREQEVSSAMVVVDNSQYELTLNIPYYYADTVKELQSVLVALNSNIIDQVSQDRSGLDQITQGKVFSVSPGISLDTRAVEVKVHTTSGAQLLKDGLFVNAWILVNQKDDALVLPYEALVVRNNQFYVYTVSEQNKAQLVPVQVGIEGLRQVEVTAGLSEGDRIVTNGHHLLVNGTAVKVVQSDSGSTEKRIGDQKAAVGGE